MTPTVLIEQFANPLTKALSANSTAADWEAGQPLSVILPKPAVHNADASLPAGSWTLAAGNVQATKLWLQPYAQGGYPLTFSMRLFGWGAVGNVAGDGAKRLVLPFFIAEFSCTTCNQPGPAIEGPPGIPPVRPMGPDEYLCDTITLTQGDLGASGWINATGGPGSPTNLPAYLEVELHGAVAFTFDFKQVDPVAMNCWWRKL